MKLYIRNMACESCILVVEETLVKLKLHPIKVKLGEAVIKEDITADKKKEFNKLIQKVGLQLIETKSAILIEKIRKCILEYAKSSSSPKGNFSDYISKELDYDYTYLSNLFSEVEGNTISNYMNSLKVERAKEYILFEDMTLTEVAEKLNYSSLAHFSAQFKKLTGFAPSHFQKVKEKRRLTIQEVASKDK